MVFPHPQVGSMVFPHPKVDSTIVSMPAFQHTSLKKLVRGRGPGNEATRCRACWVWGSTYVSKVATFRSGLGCQKFMVKIEYNLHSRCLYMKIFVLRNNAAFDSVKSVHPGATTYVRTFDHIPQ